MKNLMMRNVKVFMLSAVFATMFLVGCEQPVSSVISSEDVAYSMNSDNIAGGDVKGKNDLGPILAKLNLTAEQRAAIGVLAQQNRECEKNAMDALRAAERTIGEDFKAQRKAIEAAVRAGTKTKDAARAELKALEAAQKAAMTSARATSEAALKACRDTFIAGIKALLTVEQLATFEAWLANPKDGGGKDDGKGGDNRDDKGGIFKKLNLTADQQAQIDILTQAKRDCETPIHAALKASERTIADPFNAERAAIKAALADGSMTREAAHTQLRDIDARQKAAMAALHARAKSALKECQDTFNRSVRALLTPEQQIIWDRFIAGQDTGKDKGRDGGRKDHHRGHGKRK